MTGAAAGPRDRPATPSPPPPPRVRVTSPRRDAARRRPVERPGTAEIDEGTTLGEIYMQTYLRGHRRLLTAILVSITTLLVGLPLTFALVPGVARLSLGSVTVAWALVGVVVYPALWLLARAYTRGVERLESDFRIALQRESGRVRHEDPRC
ncbi:hypothetical protein [Arsenicicoccus dermatophilus]|uniref:hypothetical protein n=1 Tax=Arsenicicoccus dermatophilus TaxID=1076331 RepID=UPI00391710FE